MLPSSSKNLNDTADLFKTENPENSVKARLIEQGLHVDWLVRANLVANLETLVYLSEQREKWLHEDQRIILTILQEYEESKKGLIAAHEPFQKVPPRKRGIHERFPAVTEAPETVLFTTRFLNLVKAEPVVWDKLNHPDFGYHQPMRQAWCSISLKLGGWGTKQHVHVLKQFYRRKRDLYNIDFLRLGRPFAYSQELSFLKNILEMATPGEVTNGEISIEEHVKAAIPDLVYENEITEAPEHIQHVLNQVSETIDAVAGKYSREQLAEYLSLCCNEVVRNREELAIAGLHEVPTTSSPFFDSSQSDC